jgi:NAD+ synthase
MNNKNYKTIIDPATEIENICDWIKIYFINSGNANTKAVIGISGGKDSTIAAALLCRALGPDRVFGVMMPQNTQADIDDSRAVCEYLGIANIEVDIGPACDALYRKIDEAYDFGCRIATVPAVRTNTPARIRMTTLYAVAAMVGGRVVNTCNLSEDYVGYSTKYGDAAGDFTILDNYTVTEVLQIGDALGLPAEFVHKTPSDGMCGKTDEDNLGFTYAVLDDYIRDDIIPDYETLRLIKEKHKAARHKQEAIRLPGPYPELLKLDSEGNIVKGEGWF